MTDAPPPLPEPTESAPHPTPDPAAGPAGPAADRSAGLAPRDRPAGDAAHSDQPGADPHRDWFGHPIRPDGGRRIEPVPCPMCGLPFDRAAALDEHLRSIHKVVAHGRPLPQVGARFASWVRGLKFLPLWFVLLMNLLFTAILYLAWGGDLQLFSLQDQTAVAKTWAVRLSLLPSILVLVWRSVDRVD